MTRRSSWHVGVAAGLGFCLVSQGCAGDPMPSRGDQAMTARYDGSLQGFTAFVERSGKDWPVPVELAMFEGAEGAMLRYAHWIPEDPAASAGVVVFLQGRTEFIEKNVYTYRDLLSDRYEVWTFDWRGQGLSDRVLPDRPERGHIDSYGTYLADLEIFLREVVDLDHSEGRSKILLGHSMGGAVGTLHLMRHPDQFDKAVLSSPLIKLPGRVDNIFVRAGNWAKRFLDPAVCAGVFGDILDDCSWISEFQDGVDPCAIADMEPAQFLLDRNQTERYSHDIRKIAENECWIASSRPAVPSLGLGGTTSGWLRASYDATARIAAGKADLKTPLLIIGGGNDRIVSNAGQEEFCDVDNPFCCRLELEGAGHELLIEDERYRHAFFDAFRSFVTEASPPEAFCASRRQAVR